MSKDIRIPKGLDIKLKGTAEKILSDLPRSEVYTIFPTDFHGITPKLLVKIGDKVQAGDALFFSKTNERVKFASPVSGTILDILRGEKRRILEIKISADAKDSFREFGTKDPLKMSSDEVKSHVSETGCFPYFIQRPYEIIVDPNDTPKAIFISSFSTAPLAAHDAYALTGQELAFQTGINVLTKLTSGKVHISVCGTDNSFFDKLDNVEIYRVFGKHPAGNVGVQINQIDPINKGERVWTIKPQDVALIGRLFNTGKYDANRVFALAGSEVEKPQYYKAIQGAQLGKLLTTQVKNTNSRFISGDVLSGKKIEKESSLGFYTNLISVIPEGDYYTFFGWMPFTQNQKLSLSRTFFNFLMPNKEYKLDTNLNGEERALVVTGEMERVFPMDIYPMQLLKAALAGNIENMENLGIYEVAPEDFGLIDFSNTSKLEAQEVIREALDIMIKEVG
jgi:Na+-transporting NADH:ubiquinone oxidoreductase subunit A